MNEGVRETIYTSCSHLPVCKLKETYLKAQEAVNNCSIYEDMVDGDGEPVTKITRISAFDFIMPVTLRCKHYTKGGVAIR